MRKISFVLVAAMLLTAGSSFANTNPTKKDKAPKSLSTQIGDLLDRNNFTENEKGESAQVLFMLNDNKEIVVLSVDACKNTNLEGFIKSSLNYHKVDLANYKKGTKFTVSVRVKV